MEETDSFCKRNGNKIYDYFAIFVSLLDLITDIIVLVEFYELNRMEFFWVSLTILITAQISYATAFVSRYGEDFVSNCGIFICILPFAPFISIAIYIMETYGIGGQFRYNPNSAQNIDKSPLQKWMDKKLRSHLGFILEAMVESFPQSILQMVAITYYSEYTNYIAICSILISMWSVSSKSFVFAAGTALDKFTLIFNWLCVVIDFFGLFFLISWIFYNNLIYNIFFYQFIICIIPFSIWCMFAFWILCLVTTFDDYLPDICGEFWCLCACCCCICIFAAITAFIGLCFCIFIMLLQIFHWTYIALILYRFGTNRYHFENKTNANGYNNIIEWINNSNKVNYNNVSITKSQDRIIRIASTNWYMLNKWNLCKPLPKLSNYLSNHYQNAFQEITYEGLRINTDLPNQSRFVPALFGAYFALFRDKLDGYKDPKLDQYGWSERRRKKRNNLQAAIFFFPVIYLFAPLYIISRCIGIVYPFIIIIDKLLNNSETFQLDFQWMMFIIYSCGEIIILSLLFAKILRLQHIMWHILPSRSLVVPFSNDINKANQRIDQLKFSYSKLIELPIIKQLLIIKFSHDITDIILNYIWKQDEAFVYDDNL